MAKAGSWDGKHKRSFEALIGASFEYANKVMTDKRYSEADRLRIATTVINKAVPTKSDVSLSGSVELNFKELSKKAFNTINAITEQ